MFNEERTLVASVETVRAHLRTLPFEYRLTIADNASTDATGLLAHQLAHRFDDVRVVSLSQKGRSRALKQAWSRSEADVLVYMDVDLSTDLNALLPLVAPLLSGHSDLAIGSRLARTSRTTRGPRREVISRAYNAMGLGALEANMVALAATAVANTAANRRYTFGLRGPGGANLFVTVMRFVVMRVWIFRGPPPSRQAPQHRPSAG